DGAKYTYSKTEMATRAQVKNGWGLWPKNTNMKKFVALGPIDIDDFSITHTLKATQLTFVSANGAESNVCSIFTPKAKVTFDTAVAAIPANAVTMDGVDCSGGVLSGDGMSYTFDIPNTLISGTAHTVAVNTSKIAGVSVGNGEEFALTVAATDVNSAIYTQDFEDALTVYNYNSGNVTTNANVFERLVEGSNGYGHFYKNMADWYKIGFPVNEDGVTEGKLNVSFKFRPFYLSNTDATRVTFVGLGDKNKGNTGCLVLLGISTGANFGRMGVLESNGTSNSMKAADGTNAVLTSADAKNWFTYNAVIDLDTHSLDVEVVREADGAKYTYSRIGMSKRTTGWGIWPLTTKMQTFVAMGPIDIDDLSITYDTDPAVIADGNGVKASAIAKTTGDNILVIAQYDNEGRFVNATVSSVNLENGQSTVLKAEADWDSGATVARAFIWDNLENCKPLGTVKLASKP
ncbi:MAG: hypothetical protein IJT23_02525, partial [Clostridia bacterium]|nr:hypothetical protein [Clostridia bacterium]